MKEIIKENWVFFIGLILALSSLLFIIHLIETCDGQLVRSVWGFECIEKQDPAPTPDPMQCLPSLGESSCLSKEAQAAYGQGFVDGYTTSQVQQANLKETEGRTGGLELHP